MKRWCLGFAFSPDLENVLLLKKGKTMHIGKWNGLGGTIENDETSLEGMNREFQEESGIAYHKAEWIQSGILWGPIKEWRVDIYASKLHNPGFFTFYGGYGDATPDKPYLIQVGKAHSLDVAPHVGAFLHTSLAKLKNPKQGEIHFNEV